MHSIQRRRSARLGRIAALTLASVVASAAPLFSATTLTGAGATFPYPIYSKWFDMYHQKTGIQINYQSIGSGGGIRQVKEETVDFGASDAPLADKDLKAMPRKVLHFPTVAGAVAIAYNLPALKTPLRLSPEALVGIYLGKIKRWNDTAIAASNPGVRLPSQPILPVHRSDGSGTTHIFTTYVAAVSGEWKALVGASKSVSWPAGIGGKGNEGVAGLLKQTPGSIGYVELAYAKQNRLPLVHLKNKAGNYVEPTLASTTVAAGSAATALAKDVRTPIVNAPGARSYPIAGLTFLLVYQDQKDAGKAKTIADFINWAIHDGQDVAESLEYARLPEALVKVNEASLMSLTVGGKPFMSASK